MKYNPSVVTAFFCECGLPAPQLEYKFHETRKWRFDFSWPSQRVALEVQGGIWIRGAHSRGAQMKKDWEKYNVAACMGWRVLQFEPKDLCTIDTANLINLCLTGNLTQQEEI